MAVYRGEFIIVEEYGTKDPREVYKNLMDTLLTSYAKRHPLTQEKGDEIDENNRRSKKAAQ